MKHESELKVQAWLDGELDPMDIGPVTRLVREDTEAAALARELKLARQWMSSGEPPRPLPESRELFWSRVRRELAPRETQALPDVRSLDWTVWLRWVIPGVALVALVVALLTVPTSAARRAEVRPAEVETPLDDAGSFTFRSESERMTVVWVN